MHPGAGGDAPGPREHPNCGTQRTSQTGFETLPTQLSFFPLTSNRIELNRVGYWQVSSLVDEARERDEARRTLEKEKDAVQRTLEDERDAQRRTLHDVQIGEASVQEEIRRASCAADATCAVIGSLQGAFASLERWREEAASISGQLAATEQDVAELEVRKFIGFIHTRMRPFNAATEKDVADLESSGNPRSCHPSTPLPASVHGSHARILHQAQVMALSIERDRLKTDAVEMKGRFEAAEQETKGRIEAADRDAKRCIEEAEEETKRRIEAAEEETKRRIDTAEEAFASQGSLISKLEEEAIALRSVSTTILRMDAFFTYGWL